jgi:hypothetical protein
MDCQSDGGHERSTARRVPLGLCQLAQVVFQSAMILSQCMPVLLVGTFATFGHTPDLAPGGVLSSPKACLPARSPLRPGE